MPNKADPNQCSGGLESGELPVSSMGFDGDEMAIIAVARLYFLTFSEPETQAWMRAGALARAHFAARGDGIAARILEAVNELRLARASAFEFSNPECPCCAEVLCESERRFMEAFRAIRAARASTAHAQALMLCEGGDIAYLLEALADLAIALDR
ncbi:MAG: hypothetical protein AAF618_04030 [Pseudomonadota bacterium]